jgi:hypothetical protein
MTDGFSVDARQLRAHAARMDALRDRFGAVQAASSAIASDEAAYGMLCSWMAGVLERRHVRQDELIAYVRENLRLAAEALVAAGDDYDRVDEAAAGRIRRTMP